MLGCLLGVADYLSQVRINKGQDPLIMRDVLTAMIKAHKKFREFLRLRTVSIELDFAMSC